MASDGLSNKAKNGTCRMCLRVRNTDRYLKPVGEVRHGFACGYIWECVDDLECDKVCDEKIKSNRIDGVKRERIAFALKQGRFNKYIISV
jgi:hypothetical protein